MKKAFIAAAYILLIFLLAICLKADTSLALITMIAYWVFLDRIERENKQ